MLQTTRLKEPYSDCSSQEYLEDTEFLSEEFKLQNFIYTAQSATSLCLQEEIVKLVIHCKNETHIPLLH